MNYALFNATTGEIKSKGNVPDGMLLAPIVEGLKTYTSENEINAKANYVDVETGQLIDRPTFSLIENKTTIEADGADEYVVTGIPAGTKVIWPDQVRETVNDGEIRFAVDLEGEYEFKFKLFPYRDEVLSVTANAPA